MLTNNINFKNFQITKKNTAGVHQLKKLLLEKNQVLSSFSKEYKDSFLKKNILKFQKYNFVTIFGMGGSILGAKSIYSFLRNKIKKNFIFRDNYDLKKENKKKN